MKRPIILVISIFLIATILIVAWIKRTDHVAKIIHTSEGCFGSEKSILIIHKVADDQLKASYQTGKGVKEEVAVNKSKLDSLQKFVASLKNLKSESSCTILKDYYVDFEGEIIRKTDGGCSCDGFDGLVRYFFGETIVSDQP